MYLKENEKQQISKEIENLESQSSAELVAVITKNSSSYKFEIIALSLIVTTLISLIVLIIDASSLKLFQIQVLTFFTLFFFI